MPTATLKFNLPDEDAEFHMALHGHEFYAVVSDMDNWLRSKLKYGHEFKSADEALEEARKELRDLMSGIPMGFDF